MEMSAQLKKVLVVGMYSPCERNEQWLALQKRFLEETTHCTYDFGAWLSNGTDEVPFASAGVKIMGVTKASGAGLLRERANCLNLVLSSYLERLDEYENLLILDSDAFPCQHNWTDRLLAWMGPSDYTQEKHFASACSAENFDTLPHPGCFFLRGDYVRAQGMRLHFVASTKVNFAGQAFDAVNFSFPDSKMINHAWLPMLRSNVWNPHPILSGIYGGLFYHHGCGSRPVQYRAIDLRAYDNSFTRFQHGDTERKLFAEVTSNPLLFLKQLMGVSIT
jgi:hypothetical protein